MCACPCSAGPALAITAVFASNALMPRKSRRAAPATVSAVHVAPPSIVRNTWPPVQPAHATIGPAVDSERQLAVDGTVCRRQLVGPLISGSENRTRDAGSGAGVRAQATAAETAAIAI